MRAFRHKPGLAERPGRGWLLGVLALVLLWPTLLAPAHRHGGYPAPAWLAGPQQARDHASLALPDAAEGCPVCRELLHTAAYLAPPAALVLLTLASYPSLLRPETTPFALRPRPAPWRSRAPPQPPVS